MSYILLQTAKTYTDFCVFTEDVATNMSSSISRSLEEDDSLERNFRITSFSRAYSLDSKSFRITSWNRRLIDFQSCFVATGCKSFFNKKKKHKFFKNFTFEIRSLNIHPKFLPRNVRISLVESYVLKNTLIQFDRKIPENKYFIDKFLRWWNYCSLFVLYQLTQRDLGWFSSPSMILQIPNLPSRCQKDYFLLWPSVLMSQLLLVMAPIPNNPSGIHYFKR